MDRLQEICALTADGLNLAGIRRVLQLQEETRHLQAELDRLRTQPASSRKLGVRAQAGPGPRTGGATGRSGLAPARSVNFLSPNQIVDLRSGLRKTSMTAHAGVSQFVLR